MRDVPRCQVELADVGDIGHDGTGLVGPLDVEASRQFREALFLQDGGDRRWAEWLVLAGEAMADVVDGEILFPECDNALRNRCCLPGGLPSRAFEAKKLRPGPLRN